MDIYRSLIAIMRDIDPIVAGKKHPQGWRYRGVEDIYNALQPLLATHGVITIPNLLSVERSLISTPKGGSLYHALVKVEYKFVTTDGSSISATTAGEGTDSLDNAVAKAMTDAHTKCLVQVFCIPTSSPLQVAEPTETRKSNDAIVGEFLQEKGIDFLGKDSEAVHKALQFYALDTIGQVQRYKLPDFVKKIESFQGRKSNGNTDRLLAVAKLLGGNGKECKDAIELRYPGKKSIDLSPTEIEFVLDTLLTQWAVKQDRGSFGQCRSIVDKFGTSFKWGEHEDSTIVQAFISEIGAWKAGRAA